jgi:hypothetical protein
MVAAGSWIFGVPDVSWPGRPGGASSAANGRCQTDKNREIRIKVIRSDTVDMILRYGV